MKLSEKQKSIIEYTDGPMLVKAGPGSGKTRVLTERVKRLLKIMKRGKVLTLTFSNIAAEEMRSRLESDPEVSDMVNRVSISTIHSFCLEIIQSRGYRIGLRPDISLFENESDRVAILREVFEDEPESASILRRKSNPDLFLRECLTMIAEFKRALIPPESCNAHEPLPSVYHKYDSVLTAQNAMDFDDILFFTYRILIENPDVVRLYNSVYRYICIDEAQDLNNAQYRVVQALCGESFRNIMMVGDENQSIYAFNGSSSKYMSEYFVLDFCPSVFSLDENYRSAKKIIAYANSLTDSKDDISKYYYEGELRITAYPDELKEAAAVRDTIEKLLYSGHKDIEGTLKHNDFAVIGRNKYVFSYVEDEFSKANIPFYYKKTLSGISCETDHMEVFDLILRLLMNPMDIYHRQVLRKMAESEMPELNGCDTTSDLVEQILSRSKFNWLSPVISVINTDGPVNFEKVLNVLESSVPSHMTGDENSEERYLLENDIDEWRKHWVKYKSRVAGENRSLLSFRNAISLGKTQDIEAERGVVLLSAHMSKGLEFDVVFIIGLTEGTFPDYRAVKSGGSAMDQEKNNIYVASTRAKRLCYLSYPEMKMMPWGDYKKQVPSRFITRYAAADRKADMYVAEAGQYGNYIDKM